MRVSRMAGGVAAVAVTALALSACGGSAYSNLLTKVTAKASGTINLANYDPSISPFNDSLNGAVRTIPSGSTGSAKINLNASYDAGNWNVSGSYADGSVKFNFKGYALSAIACGYDVGPLCLGAPLNGGQPLADPTSGGSNAGGGPSQFTVTGGLCIPVVTSYVSTNSQKPGTGYAEFLVCDAGGPVLRTNNASPTDGLNFTGAADYVRVLVPNLDTGDRNPYANYVSGGTMSGYKSSTFGSISSTMGDPSFSPSPIWPEPSGTLSSATTAP